MVATVEHFYFLENSVLGNLILFYLDQDVLPRDM